MSMTNITPKFSMGELGQEVTVNVEHAVHEFLELFDSIRLVAPDDKYPVVGRYFLANVVRSFVETGRPVGLVLPAFPAKSPNIMKKVLGPLPDRGEELALGVLEQFCKDVESLYPPGAEVVIFSDGRVFSDLLAISAQTVGAYHQELKRMVSDAGYTHIKFDNLENHLAKDTEGGTSIDQLMLINKLLEASGIIDLETHLENDDNLFKLYQSFKCFLRLDLEPSKDYLLSEFAGASQKRLKEVFKQKCGEVAKSVILRNMAFSNFVDVAYPDMIRISIHAYNNAGPKFGVCLIPKQDRYTTPHTPWHNVIVETFRGQIQVMRREMVDMSTFEIYEHPVYKRPWGFKEKTCMEDMEKLMSSEASVHKILTTCEVTFLASLPVEIETLHPCGIILKCMDFALLSPLDIPSNTLRRLTMQFGVVVLRGFQEVECVGNKLEEVVAQIGEIVHWTNFGAVLDVKDVLDVEEVPGLTGSATSSQALPFHWDGAFRFHNSQLQETTYADTPLFVLLQCVKPLVGDEQGGETLLTDTRSVLRSNTIAEKLSMLDLASLEAEYYSPASGDFRGGRWIQHKFVSPHPITGEPTLRYLEPWPESKSANQWIVMRAVMESEAAKVAEASQLVQELIYNEEMFCYKHTWMANDFMFLDNHAVLHGRTSFNHGSERHIRRIHFN